MGDVCRVVSGATPKTSEPAFWGGDVEWITPNDMSKDRSQVLFAGERSLTSAGFASCSAQMFPAGSIIVSSRAPVGYVAIAGREMCTNQGCKTASPPDYIEPKFLYWFMVNAKPDLAARASGTTFKEISGKRFAETRIWWPDLAEQRRIVAILEEHLSDLDKASASLSAAEAKSIAMVAAARRTAVERAVALGEPSTVGQHAVLVEYGSSQKAHEIAEEGDIPVLRMGNIQGGHLQFAPLKYLSADAPGVSGLILARGDLLFNRTNSAELVGKSAVFDVDTKATFASYLIRVRFDSSVRPEWANIVVNSPQGRAYVATIASQQVGQANVNGTKLRSFPLAVPPLRVQGELIQTLGDIATAASRLRGETSRGVVRASSLRRAVLTAAFSGRLTGRSSDTDVISELTEEPA